MAFRAAFLLTTLLLTTGAHAFQNELSEPKGVIYGVVVGLDGQPLQNMVVWAFPVQNPWSGPVPQTKTDSTGRYKLERVPLGTYELHASNEEAGYPCGNWSFYFGTDMPKVQITADHPNAESRVELPPKAGFLEIHLSNRNTGTDIRGIRAKLTLVNNPDRWILTSGTTDHPLLLPPEKNVQVQISSDGFAASDQTIRLHSGDRVVLNLQLEPVNE